MNAELVVGGIKSPIYGTSHCEWMVEHGIQHSRDVWVIANRFFDAYKDFNGLPRLNDLEKYCLSCAIWLHDIGMSTMMAPINDNIAQIKIFWGEKLNGEFSEHLSPNLIRKYHSFLSRYFILHPNNGINDGNPIILISSSELRECIAIICCYHQSKWQFHDEHGNGFFGTLTNERIGEKELTYGIYRTNNGIDINILYLSALLRFFDECDQITSRVGDGTVIEADTEQKLDREYHRILNITPKNTELYTAWENCKPPEIYTMSNDKSKQNFDHFEALLNESADENIRKQIFGESYELYKSICIETHSHFIAKVILDIGFGIEKGTKIIQIQCNPEQKGVKDFKKGIKENLEICQRYFPRTPTTPVDPFFPITDNYEYELFIIRLEDNTQWVCDSPTEKKLIESKNETIVTPPDNPDYTSLLVIDSTNICNNYKDEFTGRDWLYEEINDFFKENQKKNIYAIIAPKGYGKTAIACQAREKIEFCNDIHICHSRDSRSCNPILWINKIIKCLAESDNGVKEQINEKVSTLEESLEKDPGAYFSHYFSKLTINNEGKYFVFVVDGLDEAHANSGDSVNSFSSLFKFTPFPPYIKILVTSRPGIQIGGERTKTQIESKNMDPNSKDNLSNLKDYIRNRINSLAQDIQEDQRNAFINTLNTKSAGIFLYAKVILDAIQDKHFSFDHFRNLPDNLSDVYKEMFYTRFSLKERDQLPYYNDSKNLLAVYCTNDYIPDSLIAALNKNGEVNITHKDLIKQFLIRSDKNSGFFHGSMREWLLEEGNRYYSIRDQYSSINSAICDICKEKFDDPELGDYSRINLFQHFMNAEMYGDASGLLKNPEYLIVRIRNSEYYELLSEFRQILSTSGYPDQDLMNINNFLVQRSYVLKKNPGLVEQEIINFGPDCIRIKEGEISYSWLELENKRNLLYDQLFDDHGGPIKKIEQVQNYLFAVGDSSNSQFSNSYISMWDLQSGKYDRISVRSEGNEEEPPSIKSICVSGCVNNSISIFCGLDKSEECEIKKIPYNITEKKIEQPITIPIPRPNENNIKIQDIVYWNGKIICNIGEYSPQPNPDGFDEEAINTPVYLVKNYIYILNQNDPNNGQIKIIDTGKIVNCMEVYGNTLLLGCGDGNIGVFNLRDGNEVHYKDIHKKRSVNCISIGDDGIAASGDDMGNICRWRIDPFIDLKNTFNLNKDHERKNIYSLINYKGGDNTRYLIAAGSGDLFLIKDDKERPKIQKALFLAHKKKISSMKIFKGRYLLSGSNDNLIKTWDVNKLFSPDAEQDDFNSKLIGAADILLKSADGEYLFFASTNQSEHAIKIWKYNNDRFDFDKQIVSEDHIKFLKNLGQNHLVLCDPHGGILQAGEDNIFHRLIHVCSPIRCIEYCGNNKICVATESNHIRVVDTNNKTIENSWIFLGPIDRIPLRLFLPHFSNNGELNNITIINNITDRINVLRWNNGGFIAGSQNGLLIILQNNDIATRNLQANIQDLLIVQSFLIIPCENNGGYEIRIYTTNDDYTQVDLKRSINLGYTASTYSNTIPLSFIQYHDQICVWYPAEFTIHEYWITDAQQGPSLTNISVKGKITLESFVLNDSFYLAIGGKNDLKVWKRESQGNYSLSASFNFETDVVNCMYLEKGNQPYLICGSAGGDISILKLKNLGG